jgi:hypothetical protein
VSFAPTNAYCDADLALLGWSSIFAVMGIALPEARIPVR